jgi:hypothetical protein
MEQSMNEDEDTEGIEEVLVSEVEAVVEEEEEEEVLET